MENKKRKQLEEKLKIIEQQIEDIKLDDNFDANKLKELIKEREQIKWKLEYEQH